MDKKLIEKIVVDISKRSNASHIATKIGMTYDIVLKDKDGNILTDYPFFLKKVDDNLEVIFEDNVLLVLDDFYQACFSGENISCKVLLPYAQSFIIVDSIYQGSDISSQLYGSSDEITIPNYEPFDYDNTSNSSLYAQSNYVDDTIKIISPSIPINPDIDTRTGIDIKDVVSGDDPDPSIVPPETTFDKYEPNAPLPKGKTTYRNDGDGSVPWKTKYLSDGNDFYNLENTINQTFSYFIHAKKGNDWILGSDNKDWLLGDSGNDHLYGGRGRDRIEGEDGHDHLYGGSGNDRLYGGYGNDHLYGGSGNDKLYGGTNQINGHGNDTFHFDYSLAGDKNTIFNFERGDRIDLSVLLDSYLQNYNSMSLDEKKAVLNISVNVLQIDLNNDGIFDYSDDMSIAFQRHKLTTGQLYPVVGLDIDNMVAHGQLVL